MQEQYVSKVVLRRDRVPDFSRYPFSVPAVRGLSELPLHPNVTFLVGENGSGKSTLTEALAVCSGFNPAGGSRNFNCETYHSHSELCDYLSLYRGVRHPRDGYFLRAESFYNLASQVEDLDLNLEEYGGKSLHEQSHGESFLALVQNRFRGNGLYILDEPEAALSPSRQMTLLVEINRLVKNNSQFIIATHSPILLAFPEAEIYQTTENGIEHVAYEECAHYQLTKEFLNNPQRMLKYLFEEP